MVIMASFRSQMRYLNPYEIHKIIINEYVLKRPGDTKILERATKSKDKTDYHIIKEHHKFLWDVSDKPDTWEEQFAKRYYEKLFKEYCIADLSRYKENKVALRWRIAKEVVSGKGQFICGNKKCIEKNSLRSWEVNFMYQEKQERKNALVKISDGDCLFRAVSYCLYNNKEHHREIRLQVVEHIINNWEYYKDFIIGDSSYKFLINNSAVYENLIFLNGLCPLCSKKLNYNIKKREVKRLQKKNKYKEQINAVTKTSWKKSTLDTKVVDNSSTPSTSNCEDEQVTQSKTPTEESLWESHKSVQIISREEEMEEYLQELLL